MESLRKLLVLGCCLAVAGCAAQGTGILPGAPGPSGLPTLRQPDRSPLVLGNAKRKTGGNPAIYLFTGEPDACCPTVGLVNIGNTLYGTTYSGGTDNIGTLYSVTTAGKEKVMHSFTGIPDRRGPASRADRRQRHALRHNLLWWKRSRHDLLRHVGRVQASVRLRERIDERLHRAGLDDDLRLEEEGAVRHRLSLRL